ncbi:hypothetical protein Fot_40823 [Forsythia ovata]|uniref:No apical meristem-associated C-terminal domain-containing protein n=1 Tax=Forsythia ovata TaxID=205694 RepID=A0ABD1RHB7_9LAMI
MSIIITAVGKLRGCIRQVEYSNPSGASEQDIIDEENVGGTSTGRPIGIKKAKGKKKTEEENAIVIEEIREQNRQLSERLTKRNDDKQQNYHIQMLRAQTEAKKVDVAAKKVAVAEIREENRILLTNLNDVADPNLRELIRSEQKRIVQKRSDELAKQSQSTSTPFGQYFDDFGGSGNDLPDY